MKKVTYLNADGIGYISIANPPVNTISIQLVRELGECVQNFKEDINAYALIIHCKGRTFVAGGDINGFDDPSFSPAPFNAVLADIEQLERPVIAALHGTVLGGGLELALACHFRVADERTRLGLPEVNLGLIPGSLGTQRLPRLVGISLALDMMMSGRHVKAQEALTAGLVDTLAKESSLEVARAWAHSLATTPRMLRRLSQQSMPSLSAQDAELLEQALARALRKSNHPALQAIVHCVQAAATQRFETGAQLEAASFKSLMQSSTSRALRHLFFAERQASQIPGLSPDLERRTIGRVGVLGAGTMGSGIAMCFLQADIPVVLVDSTQAGLDRGAQLIRSTYESQVSKGRLTPPQAEERLQLLQASLEDSALQACDLVIEAVYENMDLKLQVCERLGALCKPGAIIATNTSTLDVDVLAAATGRAADVVGMHFFSPAHIMRLLEVVRGAQTAPQVLATVLDLARRIGKTAVVSGVCYGFIGNRMAEVYMREAEFLMMEGASPSEIDAAVEKLGMAMGPCRMLDMAGIDVGAKTVIEYGKAGGLPPDDSYRAVVRRMFELGRFGQKTGVGYYRYEGRQAQPEASTVQIAEELAQIHQITRRSSISEQEIVERLLYPLVNEGFRILDEGISYRASDIDVVWAAGYGFPDFLGGPMHWAEQIGLHEIVERLNHYAQVRGNTFGYWNVSPLLKRQAERTRSQRSLQAA